MDAKRTISCWNWIQFVRKLIEIALKKIHNEHANKSPFLLGTQSGFSFSVFICISFSICFFSISQIISYNEPAPIIKEYQKLIDFVNILNGLMNLSKPEDFFWCVMTSTHCAVLIYFQIPMLFFKEESINLFPNIVWFWWNKCVCRGRFGSVFAFKT